MSTISSLEQRIQKIELRNQRVEADKAWETSWIRKISIVILTYFFVGLNLTFIAAPNPWVNATVPVLGFILSTLSLDLIKNYWVKNR